MGENLECEVVAGAAELLLLRLAYPNGFQFEFDLILGLLIVFVELGRIDFVLKI